MKDSVQRNNNLVYNKHSSDGFN